MFYFLISACQTVIVVNGHQERPREREEEPQRETKVLWGLKRKKPGKHLRVAVRDGRSDKHNAPNPSPSKATCAASLPALPQSFLSLGTCP